MAPHKNVTPEKDQDTEYDIEDRITYQNSLPKELQESVWATSTLWNAIIVFTICALILVIGGSIYLLR